MDPFFIQYGNDTGPDDEYFEEFWYIYLKSVQHQKDVIEITKMYNKAAATELCAILNKAGIHAISRLELAIKMGS